MIKVIITDCKHTRLDAHEQRSTQNFRRYWGKALNTLHMLSIKWPTFITIILRSHGRDWFESVHNALCLFLNAGLLRQRIFFPPFCKVMWILFCSLSRCFGASNLFLAQMLCASQLSTYTNAQLITSLFFSLSFPIPLRFVASAPLSCNETSYQELWKSACFPFRMRSLNVTCHRMGTAEPECATSTNSMKSFFLIVLLFDSPLSIDGVSCTKNEEFMCG